MKNKLKLKVRGDDGTEIIVAGREQAAYQRNEEYLDELNRTGVPPKSQRLPPTTYTAVRLEQDEEWEHSEYGTIVGQEGNWKVTNNETGETVQYRDDDLKRVFEEI